MEVILIKTARSFVINSDFSCDKSSPECVCVCAHCRASYSVIDTWNKNKSSYILRTVLYTHTPLFCGLRHLSNRTTQVTLVENYHYKNNKQGFSLVFDVMPRCKNIVRTNQFGKRECKIAYWACISHSTKIGNFPTKNGAYCVENVKFCHLLFPWEKNSNSIRSLKIIIISSLITSKYLKCVFVPLSPILTPSISLTLIRQQRL